MSEWQVKQHPDFFRDLDKLSVHDLEIFYKKLQKTKENPMRLKHLSGGLPCYREPITRNIRIIYSVEGSTIWLLTIGPHDDSYENFRKRLYTLREKYGLNKN